MPSSWNPPLHLTPVMPVYWYLQFPCQSFPVPGPHDEHKQDSWLTHTKHRTQSYSKRWSILISQDTCRQRMLSNWPWHTAQFISWAWIRLTSICKENYISHGYQSMRVCVLSMLSITLTTENFPRKCVSHIWSFAGNHHGCGQLLPVSGPASRACQHWQICCLPQQRAPKLSHATNPIQFTFTPWDEVYNQMILKHYACETILCSQPKCNFHSEIYLSNLCFFGKGTLTSCGCLHAGDISANDLRNLRFELLVSCLF